MLSNRKIIITADTIEDDGKVTTYVASLNVDTGELSLSGRNLNEEAAKVHKDIVRTDRATFEDLAYLIQDTVNATSMK